MKKFSTIFIALVMTVFFSFYTFSSSEAKSDRVSLNDKIDNFLNRKMENLNLDNSRKGYLNSTKDEGFKIFEVKNKKLENFFKEYDNLVRERYERRGISDRVVRVIDEDVVEKMDGSKKIISIKRLYEMEYSDNGVVDSEHGIEEVVYHFVFDVNNRLIDYKSSNPEEMALLNKDLSEIKRKEIKNEIFEKHEIERVVKETNNDNKDELESSMLQSRGLRRFNRSKMYNYAKKHAYNYNSNYADMSSMGGDCTNFASQILRAGGAPYDTTGSLVWYYYGLGNMSSSWSYSGDLYYYLIENDYKGPQGVRANTNQILYSMQLGDFVFIDLDFDESIDHTVIITGYQIGESKLTKVSAHTSNHFNKPLNRYGGFKKYVMLKGYL